MRAVSSVPNHLRVISRSGIIVNFATTRTIWSPFAASRVDIVRVGQSAPIKSASVDLSK
jgi:hypothetical protein